MIGTWRPVVRFHEIRQALIWDVECSSEMCDAIVLWDIHVHVSSDAICFQYFVKACMHASSRHIEWRVSFAVIYTISTGGITTVPPLVFSSFFSLVLFSFVTRD